MLYLFDIFFFSIRWVNQEKVKSNWKMWRNRKIAVIFVKWQTKKKRMNSNKKKNIHGWHLRQHQDDWQQKQWGNCFHIQLWCKMQWCTLLCCSDFDFSFLLYFKKLLVIFNINGVSSVKETKKNLIYAVNGHWWISKQEYWLL